MEGPVESSHPADNTGHPTITPLDPALAYQPVQAPGAEITAGPTHTRNSFTSSEKRPLSPQHSPDTPALVPPAGEGDLSRQESLQSLKSNDTHASSNTGAAEDGPEGSDCEDGTTYRPQKKKKSQRFYCTDYPPCNLSFTRSEHLARHIRKHTGERPFQCHCLRRFSRLDNLRQHAQTVHVNEDIPVDSLAATGTRFQRQIRTERMKTSSHRPRTSTLGSGSHSRGHSRNLSGSSIDSATTLGSPDDMRRRPQPLAMAQPATPRQAALSVDTYSTNVATPYYNYAPSGYSTPMSAYSAEAASPRMSSLGSPIAMVPRSAIGWGGQNHSRRLSVPSTVHPFQAQQYFAAPQAPFMSPMMPSVMPHYSGMGAPYASPPRDGAQHARSESLDAVEAEWRRRTWHPSSRHSFGSRPATSGLTYHQKPDDPQAVPTTQPAAQQAVRLPGIDSFDRSSMQPGNSSRTDVDTVSIAAETDDSSKRNSWNSMNQNMNQLELVQNAPQQDVNCWRHSTGSQSQLMARPVTAPHSGSASQHLTTDLTAPQANMGPSNETLSQGLHTPRQSSNKLLKMVDMPTSPPVGEPGPAIRTSPDGSTNSEEVHTPSGTADYRPAIVHSDGHIERQGVAAMEEPSKVQYSSQPGMQPFAVPAVPTPVVENALSPRGHDTKRLDALVAVATSEDQAIAQH